MDGVGLTIFFTAGMANLGQLPFLCAIPLSIYLRQRKSGRLHGLYLGPALWFGTITYVKHPWMGSLLLVNDSLVLPC